MAAGGAAPGPAAPGAAVSGDVMDVGTHCAQPDCAQLDFLPFRCAACAATFCAAHRGKQQHACPREGDDDVSVLVCPLCAAAVRLGPGEDANAVWAAHAGDSAACDPGAYAARVHKPRCPVAGCREKLTFSNRVACKACGRATCLRHRFADDHGCAAATAGARAAAAAASRAAAARAAQQSQGWRAAPPALPPKQRAPTAADRRAAAAAQFADPANSLRGTAARRMDGGGAGPEACPTCGARFADVAALIAHAEASHGGGGGARLREVCPACGARFADAVALVAHHDAAHAGRGAPAEAACALC